MALKPLSSALSGLSTSALLSKKKPVAGAQTRAESIFGQEEPKVVAPPQKSILQRFGDQLSYEVKEKGFVGLNPPLTRSSLENINKARQEIYGQSTMPSLTENAQNKLALDEQEKQIQKEIKRIDEEKKKQKTVTLSPKTGQGSSAFSVDSPPDVLVRSDEFLDGEREKLLGYSYNTEKERFALERQMTQDDWDSIENRKKFEEATRKEYEEKYGDSTSNIFADPAIQFEQGLYKTAFGVLPALEEAKQRSRGVTQEELNLRKNIEREVTEPKTAIGKLGRIAGDFTAMGIDFWMTDKFLAPIYALIPYFRASKPIRGVADAMSKSSDLFYRGGYGAARESLGGVPSAIKEGITFSAMNATSQMVEKRNIEPLQVAESFAAGALLNVAFRGAGNVFLRSTTKKYGEATFIIRPGEEAYSEMKLLGVKIPKSIGEIWMNTVQAVKGVNRRVIFKDSVDGSIYEMRFTPHGDGTTIVDVTQNAPNWLRKTARKLISLYTKAPTEYPADAALRLLGISREATASEIKSAYREKVALAHPDKGGSEKAMKELNAAYKILTTAPEKARPIKWEKPPVVVDVPERPLPETKESFVTVGKLKIQEFLGGKFFPSFQRESQLGTNVFITSEEATKITRQYFSEEEVSVEIVNKIATPEGERALGKYREGMISFVENPHESTPDHEAVHAYLDLYAAPGEKDSILQDIIDSGSATNRTEAEEKVADGFVEYVRSGKVRGFTRRVIEWFRDMYAKIKGLLGKPDKVRQLYRDIILKRRNAGMEPGTTTPKDVRAVQTANFQEPGTLTTKLLKGITKPEVGSQEIRDLLRKPDIKQAERDVITSVLDSTFKDDKKINMEELRRAVEQELLPLDIVTKERWSEYQIPESIRGDSVGYVENVYTSPFPYEHKLHYPGVKNLFGHVRSDQVTENGQDIRRLIEVQGDPFQQLTTSDMMNQIADVTDIDESIKDSDAQIKDDKSAIEFYEHTRTMVDGRWKNYKDAFKVLDQLEDDASKALRRAMYEVETSNPYRPDDELRGKMMKRAVKKDAVLKKYDENIAEAISNLTTRIESGNVSMEKLKDQREEKQKSVENLQIPEMRKEVEIIKSAQKQIEDAKVDIKSANEKIEIMNDEIEKWSNVKSVDVRTRDNISDLVVNGEVTQSNVSKYINEQAQKIRSGGMLREATTGKKKAEKMLEQAKVTLMENESILEKAKVELKKIEVSQKEKLSNQMRAIFVYRQTFHERLLKEELRHWATEGVDALRIPTPQTLALILMIHSSIE